MRNIERKSILLALSITLIITSLLMYYIQIKSIDIEPQVKVVVAAMNIKEKTMITDKDLTEIEIPKKYAISGSINDKNIIIGKIARENIYTGEQIIQEKLLQGREKDGLSAVVPEGYRAISINVDPVSSVGGNIEIGDRIDVLVFLKSPYTESEKIKTVFQNVEILDISGQNKEFLTLCMTPEDAEKLFLIDQIGETRMVLRQIVDKKENNLPGTGIDSVQ